MGNHLCTYIDKYLQPRDSIEGKSHFLLTSKNARKQEIEANVVEIRATLLGFVNTVAERMAQELLKELRAHSFQLDSTIFFMQKLQH